MSLNHFVAQIEQLSSVQHELCKWLRKCPISDLFIETVWGNSSQTPSCWCPPPSQNPSSLSLSLSSVGGWRSPSCSSTEQHDFQMWGHLPRSSEQSLLRPLHEPLGPETPKNRRRTCSNDRHHWSSTRLLLKLKITHPWSPHFVDSFPINSSEWIIGFLFSSLDEWKHWFSSHGCCCCSWLTEGWHQVLGPPSFMPSSPSSTPLGLVGWIRELLVGVSMRVCVCWAHADWGPKGKAFHADLSQLPCF